MTAGEFINKLKARIHEAGYTTGNVNILEITQNKYCISLLLEDKDREEFKLYIEED